MIYIDTLHTVEIETDTGFVTTVGGQYDGSTFQVASSSWNDGRRLVVMDIAGGSFPEVQDQGRVPRTTSLDIYIIGDGCLERRDTLIESLTARGLKDFVHPYFGHLKARAGKFSVGDQSTTLRYCAMTVEFVVLSDTVSKVFIPDTKAAIELQSATLIDNILKKYNSIMDFAESGKAYLTTIKDGVTSAQLAIVEARASVRSLAEYQSLAAGILVTTDAVIRNASTFMSDTIALVTFTNMQSVGIKNAWFELINANHDVEKHDNSTYEDLDNVDGNQLVDEALALLALEVDYKLPDYLPDTANKRAYIKNMDAFNKVIKIAALTSLSQNVSNTDFDSLEEIAKYSADINDAFYDVLELVQDDQEMYNNIQVLQATTLLDLENVSLALPSIETVDLTTGGTVLEVVGSYYKDPLDAETVISMNNIKHPLFVPEGTTMELVND